MGVGREERAGEERRDSQATFPALGQWIDERLVAFVQDSSLWVLQTLAIFRDLLRERSLILVALQGRRVRKGELVSHGRTEDG